MIYKESTEVFGEGFLTSKKSCRKTPDDTYEPQEILMEGEELWTLPLFTTYWVNLLLGLSRIYLLFSEQNSKRGFIIFIHR